MIINSKSSWKWLPARRTVGTLNQTWKKLLVGASILTTCWTVEASLTFRPFESNLPCADGSPAGIYSNFYLERSSREQPFIDETKHVIVFMGGGVCTSPEDCLNEFKSEPYKFTSSTLPEEIRGDTILAEDEMSRNPFQNHTKWLVPYCTQDLYLGDIKKGKIGGFVASGSALFTQVIDHWRETVSNGQQQVEHLAIVGTSAGAIGVMNHIRSIQLVAQTMGLLSVLYILDSASLSDRHDNKNLTEAMDTYVDFTEHPLCDTKNYYSELYNQVTDLPCCLSTHCMLRHDDDLAKILGSGDPTVEGPLSAPSQDVVLFDSSYDPFSIYDSVDQGHGQESFSDVISKIWNVAEVAGSRIVRPLETSAAFEALTPKLGPRVHWIVSSCVTHGFFVPSIELLHQACSYGNFQDKEYDVVCRDDAVGVRTSLELVAMGLTLWLSTDTWNLATVQGFTVREIVSAFIVAHDKVESGLSFPNDISKSEHIRVFVDRCHGPNCNADSEASNQCQSLIELEETFVTIPTLFEGIWYSMLVLIILSTALRGVGRSFGSNGEEMIHGAEASTSENEEIKLGRRHKLIQNRKEVASVQGLNVYHAATGKPILKDIDLKLHACSVNAIMGRSGSGKSTLLNFLSQKRLQGLTVSARDLSSDIKEEETAYLRQGDSVKMENMKPCEYLLLTGSIYGTERNRTDECVRFVRDLFSRAPAPGQPSEDEESMVEDRYPPARAEEAPAAEINPFYDVKIRNLSGGQRRILALAAALLMSPRLVLLDEPLSGIDSATSSLIMKFVEYLSTQHGFTIVMTLHQPSHFILDFFDRVIVLESGTLARDEYRSAHRSSRVLAKELDSLLSSYVRQSTRMLLLHDDSSRNNDQWAIRRGI